MNNSLTNSRLMPQRAIIVYHGNGEYNRDYYLESREIVQEKGKYVFMAPQPMAKDVMKKIAGSFIKRNSLEMDFGGLIPEHILFATNRPGMTAVIWYRPAAVRKLNFSANLQIKGQSTVSLPATLYLVLNTTLYIFALMTDDRPTATTKLYNAPFFNIYKDGNVCLGTAPIGKVRAKTFGLEAERYERGFFMAEQNGGTSVPCKTPLAKLWAIQIKKGGAFPSKGELIQHPTFKTLADLINKIIGTNGNNNTQAHLEDEEEEEIGIEI